MFPLFGILHRMIFWELVRVFLLSLTGLTGLFLIGGLVQQAAQFGLSPAQILKIIPLIVPFTLPYTIPATTLFASCVVYGRLSADNEAVAIKAAGVDLLTALRPALLLGILTTAATGALSYSLIPQTQTKLQQQLLKDPEEVLYSQLRRERRIGQPSFPFVIHVRDVQGKRLIDVVLKRRIKTPDGKFAFGYDMVARAREARLVVDLAKKTLSIDADRWTVVGASGSSIDASGTKSMDVDLPDSFSADKAKAKSITLEWEELPQRIAELEAVRDDLISKREANRKAFETASADQRALITAQEPHYAAQIDFKLREIRVIEYEQWMRPALAAGCLCFALIGCPVGIWANRADYLSTFVTCFLPTVFVYYPLLLAGGGLARDGKVPMPVGVLLADAAGLLGALLLTWKLIRR